MTFLLFVVLGIILINLDIRLVIGLFLIYYLLFFN